MSPSRAIFEERAEIIARAPSHCLYRRRHQYIPDVFCLKRGISYRSTVRRRRANFAGNSGWPATCRIMTPILFTCSPLLMLLASTDGWLLLPAMLFFPMRQPFQKPTYEYDITIIGAGASGLLAAGVASSVGFKTLLIERAQIDGGAPGRVEFNVGGDCTNAACVPSKAIRSIAKMAYASSRGNSIDHDTGHRNRSNKWLELARRQANDAVGRVRAREDPNRMISVPNLELEFVKDCKFLSSHEMRLKCYDNSEWIQGLNGTVSNAAATNVVEKGNHEQKVSHSNRSFACFARETDQGR